jgi:hypothetical protein
MHLVLNRACMSVESSMLPPNESSISPVPPTTHREKEIGLFRKCCCGCCAFVRRHITHRLSMHTDDGHMLCISGITLYTRNKVCLVGSLSHGGVRTGVHTRACFYTSICQLSIPKTLLPLLHLTWGTRPLQAPPHTPGC